MSSNSKPDFSSLRSSVDRAEAERGYEVGVDIAEGLIALAAFFRRCAAALAEASVRRAAERARITWE